MADPLLPMDELIQAAREHSEALGDLMERYRGYLRLIAEQEIGPRLGRRVDASDVVQQTFLKACREFEHFDGSAEPQFSAWLTQILRRNIADVVRDHVMTAKRAVGKERPLHDPENSALLSWHEPAAQQSTPSQRAIRGEQAIRLAQVLDSLPKDQREAVRLRHLEGWSLERIAREMDRSVVATAGLIYRGQKALRGRMSESSWM